MEDSEDKIHKNGSLDEELQSWRQIGDIVTVLFGEGKIEKECDGCVQIYEGSGHIRSEETVFTGQRTKNQTAQISVRINHMSPNDGNDKGMSSMSETPGKG
eukprot:g36428.t1